MANNYGQRCIDITTRFLSTAVIVDDEPQLRESRPTASLTQPGRTRSTPAPNVQRRPSPQRNRRSLDAKAITDAFARLGLICGVFVPNEDGEVDGFRSAVRRADVVILDWQMYDDNGCIALTLLRSILNSDYNERFRLIAIYTGHEHIQDIGATITDELAKAGFEFESEPDANHNIVLFRGHCRIAVYAKFGTRLQAEFSGRVVNEERLADRLISDFAEMVEGLLPSIALTALTAVRENAHRVLDKFEVKLDPSYLSHRACLPSPDDSERHMVDQLASELHGIMDQAVTDEQSAGMHAIKQWLAKFKGGGDIAFGSSNTITLSDTVRLLKEGVDNSNVLSNSKKKKAQSFLSSGFVRERDGNAQDLDLQFASMMCFRTVFDRSKRILRMGTTMKKNDGSRKPKYYLCMRPQCDSVRIESRESFLFVPLLDPPTKSFQIVISTGNEERPYLRVSVGMKMSEWRMIDFVPDRVANSVVADTESEHYWFTDACGTKYEWIGELKAELAQSVAQSLASTLSRIALDKSEWLRRTERAE